MWHTCDAPFDEPLLITVIYRDGEGNEDYVVTIGTLEPDGKWQIAGWYSEQERTYDSTAEVIAWADRPKPYRK